MQCGKQIAKELEHASGVEKLGEEEPSVQKYCEERACFHENIQRKPETKVTAQADYFPIKVEF